MMIDKDMNSDAFFDAVFAVQMNNKMNGATWGDWTDAHDVSETYQIDLCEFGVHLINRAIASNGNTIDADVEAVKLAVFGQTFARE